MRVITIVGARPQFIKAAVVSKALKQQGITELMIHTDQHYDINMSKRFFEELDIPAPIHLGVGSGSQGAQTGRMLEAIERVLMEKKPDWVMVFGDTNSTLAGALAAVKLHIPVAHVEAGLRSFNRRMPEEINRVAVDHMSNLLFAPTELAMENMRREGLPDERMFLVGDVMYDATLQYQDASNRRVKILDELGLASKQYILMTIHRAENTDNRDRLTTILDAFVEVSEHIPVLLPLHPRTRAALEQHGVLERARTHLKLIDPVGYLDMVALEQNSRLIATDSGGVQKEAFFMRVPCVTLRDETEWQELVDWGWNRLVPPHNSQEVLQSVLDTLSDAPPEPSPLLKNAYGGGLAAEKVAKLLLSTRR